MAVAAIQAQQPADERLRALAVHGDGDSLLVAVRERPVSARELLGEFIDQVGRARASIADSVLQLAHRLARAYAVAWDDSFPMTNLARFERMTAEQRAAKVVADSVRLAGNAAFGKHGVNAAIRLWRGRGSALTRFYAATST